MSQVYKEVIGKNLRLLLAEKNDQASLVAAALGVSPVSVSHWLHSKKSPSDSHLKALADYFELSPRDLVNQHLFTRHQQPRHTISAA